MNFGHGAYGIGHVLQRVGQNECTHGSGLERQCVDVFDPVNSASRSHIASEISLARKEWTQFGDCFLPRNLERTDLDDQLGTNQSLRAKLQKFTDVRTHRFSGAGFDDRFAGVYFTAEENDRNQSRDQLPGRLGK